MSEIVVNIGERCALVGGLMKKRFLGTVGKSEKVMEKPCHE
jgi:hypothetical protein